MPHHPRSAAVAILVASSILAGPRVSEAGRYPGFTETITDSSAVFAIPNTARPSYLHTFEDPTFRLPVTRVTGYWGTAIGSVTGVWGDDARHHYSKDEPWNSDGTLLEVYNDGTPTSAHHLLLDGETYQPLYGRCSNYNPDDDRWHPSRLHPHERIGVLGTELMWFDVVACVKTRSWALPFETNNLGGAEGNPSADGRFLALNDSTRVFVVDMEPAPPFAPYPASRIGPALTVIDCALPEGCIVKWASVSPSGRFVVVDYGGEHLRVFDVDSLTLALHPHPMPASEVHCSGTDPAHGFVYDLGHADLALDPFDGNADVLVGQEQCGNRGKLIEQQPLGGVLKVRLRDGALTSLSNPVNESYPHHISARNVNRPGWVYVGYWPYDGERFADEIVAVKMDGSGTVQRLAHKHSAFVGCYRCESHAVPSRDGRRVLWASNWAQHCSLCGDSADVKAYVVDARDARGNLIGNPSFEGSTIGWAPTGSATLVRHEGGVDGFYEGRLIGGSGRSEFALNDSPNWVSATAGGRPYAFSVWVRSTGAGGRCFARAREYAAGVLHANVTSNSVTLSADWQLLTGTVTPQVAGSTLDFNVVDQPAAQAETLIVDDAAIAPVAEVTLAAAEGGPAPPPRIAPNPLRTDSALEFTTTHPGRVRVDVLDVSGRRIAAVCDGTRAAGAQRISLRTVHDAMRAHAGIYFIRVFSPDGCTVQRTVVLE